MRSISAPIIQPLEQLPEKKAQVEKSESLSVRRMAMATASLILLEKRRTLAEKRTALAAESPTLGKKSKDLAVKRKIFAVESLILEEKSKALAVERIILAMKLKPWQSDPGYWLSDISKYCATPIKNVGTHK